MIQPIEEEKPEEKLPEFTQQDIHAVFCIMLKLLGGGLVIKGDSLKSFSPNMKWNAQYDKVNDRWIIFLPKKRERGIVKPRRKIIVPN